MSNKTILGISPGTKRVGIVIMRNGTLLKVQMRNFRGPWKRSKLLRILELFGQIIDEYNVEAVGIKTIRPELSSEAYIFMMNAIFNIFIERRIQILAQDINEIKSYIPPCLPKNKKSLAEYASTIFPELKWLLGREKQNRNKYYEKVFEAAMLCWQIDQKKFK